MQYRNNKTRPAPIFRAWENSPAIRIILAQRQKLLPGLTLVEMVIAMAIITIILAVILPQFRVIHNNWDSQAGAAETLQNGRVLIDHLNRNLSKAVRITAVSNSSETNGYIEFQDNDANNLRYDIGTNNYVKFGPIGSLSDLAGPVSQLQFTCYSATDLSTPITDVNSIRSVKIETTLTNTAKLDQDMTFSTQAYIRTNALPVVGGIISKLSEPWLVFMPSIGMEPALAHMSGTKYLCAYRSNRDDGWARILTVNPADWSVSAGSFFEYDTKQGITPDLAKIGDTHLLCVYQGDRGDGWSHVLYETTPGELTDGPGEEFDTADCVHPALSEIDSSHFLCAYFNNISSVRTLVLTVDPGSWSINKGPTAEFACDLVCNPDLVKIDDTHHLCAYRGSNLRLWAVVLTVDPANWTVTTETPFEVAPSIYAYEPTLAKIDDTHYLYAFHSNTSQGCAVVLTVHTSDWTITKDTAYDYYQFSDAAGSLELCQIDSTGFLCAYEGGWEGGLAIVLTVNTSDWSLSHGAPFAFESGTCSEPALCQIDASHYLCAYAGLDNVGYVGVLGISGGIMP
jgi:type II secretory pathway pseudopilin PulG